MIRIRPHRSHPMLVLGSSLLALFAGCGGEAPPQESGVHTPAALSARSVLETAFATADRTQRLVFLHSGADW